MKLPASRACSPIAIGASEPANERDRAARPGVGRREWKGENAERFHGTRCAGRADDGLIIGCQQSARDAGESGDRRTECKRSNGDPRARRVRSAKEPPSGDKRDRDYRAERNVVPSGMIDRLPRKQDLESDRSQRRPARPRAIRSTRADQRLDRRLHLREGERAVVTVHHRSPAIENNGRR